MKKKKAFGIYMSIENNQPFLKTEYKGKRYKTPFNPHMSAHQQCSTFVDAIIREENETLLSQSRDFYDYMFRRMTND